MTQAEVVRSTHLDLSPTMDYPMDALSVSTVRGISGTEFMTRAVVDPIREVILDRVELRLASLVTKLSRLTKTVDKKIDRRPRWF
jgi:hypothetical protein